MIGIQRGRVALTRLDVTGEPRLVETKVRGDLLAEGMLIEGSVHSTTATAESALEVVVPRRERLFELFTADPSLEKRMLASLLDEIVNRFDQLMFRTSGHTKDQGLYTDEVAACLAPGRMTNPES